VTGKPFRRLLDRSHPGSYYQEKELDNRFVLPSPDPLLEEAFEKFEVSRHAAQPGCPAALRQGGL
jgi:hypothetical protein